MPKSSGAVARSFACSSSFCIADRVTCVFISFVYLISCISISDRWVSKSDVFGLQLRGAPSSELKPSLKREVVWVQLLGKLQDLTH